MLLDILKRRIQSNTKPFPPTHRTVCLETIKTHTIDTSTNTDLTMEI